MSSISISHSYVPAARISSARRPHGASGTSRSTLRLTRRGRVALVLAALGAIVLLGFTLGDPTVATSQAGSAAPTRTVTVKPGETLWQIAAEANPRGDIRQSVEDIMKLNSLSSAAGLQMGREIAVPVYTK